jgi:hypothetical protein
VEGWWTGGRTKNGIDNVTVFIPSALDYVWGVNGIYSTNTSKSLLNVIQCTAKVQTIIARNTYVLNIYYGPRILHLYST